MRARRFREDLYFRLGPPEVIVPPLRERLDEIPWLLARELSAVDPRLSSSVMLIEACARGTWPGNVRELLREARRAAHHALQEGVTTVQPHHLASEAGAAFGAQESSPQAEARAAPPAKLAVAPSDEQIKQAIADQGGNVRGAARALGMHRNQLRRWLDKHPEVGADPQQSPSDEPPAGESSDEVKPNREGRCGATASGLRSAARAAHGNANGAVGSALDGHERIDLLDARGSDARAYPHGSGGRRGLAHDEAELAAIGGPFVEAAERALGDQGGAKGERHGVTHLDGPVDLDTAHVSFELPRFRRRGRQGELVRGVESGGEPPRLRLVRRRPTAETCACCSLTTMPTRASVPGTSPLKTRETGLASLSSPPLQANTVSARNIRAGAARTLVGERFTRGVTSPYVAPPW